MDSWSSRMVEALAEFKRDGLPFDDAWDAALARHRPTARDRRLREAGSDAQEPLFDTDASGQPVTSRDESLVEFTYRACSDAWFGRRRELRPLLSLLDRDELFERAPSPSIRLGSGGRMLRAA